MKKSIIGLVVVIIILLVIILGQGSDTAPAEGQVIKIGVVAPLTGGASVYGTNLVKGAELALKQLDMTKNTYQLFVEDDGTNPAQAASAAQKLINIEKVDAILAVTSGTGNAVKPLAVSAKIPHICLCSDTRVAEAPYSFTNILMADDEARTWLAHAKTLGVKNISIIRQNQSGFNLLVDSLVAQATSSGFTIVYDEKIEPAVKDFKTSIAKARAAKPDVILVGFFPPQIDIIGKELKSLGVTNISGIATFAIAADTSLFNDRWYSDAFLSDLVFADEFAKTFPDTRFNVRVAPYAYDSLNLLVKGFESGSVTKYLLDVTSYPGKAGNLTKEKGAASFHSPIGIWEMREGKAVQVK